MLQRLKPLKVSWKLGRNTLKSNLLKGSMNQAGSSEAYKVKVATEDEEHARIMARLDELEMEEFAASRSDEDEDNGADFGCSKHPPKNQMQEHGKLFDTTQKPPSGSYSQPNRADNSTFEDFKAEVLAKDESLDSKSSRYNMQKSSITKKSSDFPESTEKARAISAPKIEEKIHAVSTPELETVQTISTPKNEDSDDNVVGHTTSKIVSDRQKACSF
ncbi:uncharacterized protein LOC143889915 isoform X2 [Tasmannia lanceolata]|uniref:uncharacterized protein LOC143889915 isoform X2 n=1 Tax=Tasmannia lanceolata TaxID=3420 RepID=UPI004062F6CA